MKRPRFNELFCLLVPSSGYTIFKSRSTALEKKRKESSDDIFEEIIAKLQAGIDLKCHESRKRFVDYLCSESHARKALAKSVDMMVKNYYRLLKPLPAIGGHCTTAAVLIGCHAQRNGPIESNGEI